MGYDAIVIGAGLAGLRTALLLGEGGARVLLVDRRRAVTEGVRTTGIFVRRTFEDFDFPAGALGPAVRRVLLYSPKGRALELESTRPEFRVGRMRLLYQELLDACARVGVLWCPGTLFESLEVRPGGARVRLRSGTRAWSETARLVVGADGAKSRVGAALGLSRNRKWIVGAERVYPSAGGGAPAFHCLLDPRLAPGYLGWVVDDGEEVHVGVGGYGRRFDPAPALAALEAGFARRWVAAGRRPLERRGGLIPVNGVLRRIACEHGLLVGDAAGAVSPLTAGGLDACVRLSGHAAAVALTSLERDDPSLLRAYDGRAYRSRFVSRLALRRVMDVLSTPWLLEAGHAALDTALLRPLAEHVFFGRGSFPDAGSVRGSLGDPAGPLGSGALLSAAHAGSVAETPGTQGLLG